MVALIDREEERQWLTGILLEDRFPGDEQKVYHDSLMTLKRQKLSRQINKVTAELAAADRAGDASAANEMAVALAALNIERQRI